MLPGFVSAVKPNCSVSSKGLIHINFVSAAFTFPYSQKIFHFFYTLPSIASFSLDTVFVYWIDIELSALLNSGFFRMIVIVGNFPEANYFVIFNNNRIKTI